MIDFNRIKEILCKYNSFILTCHVNPDADAVGAEAALSEVLNILNKKVSIINHSSLPDNLEFLNYQKKITTYSVEYDEEIKNAECIIFLDLNTIDRVASMHEVAQNSNAYKVVIDHHQNPKPFADEYFTDIEFCATCHILYEMIRETKIVEMNFNIAQAIYAGIMTDTGSFKFDRTTPAVHRIAAHLLELGVQSHIVYDKLYDQSEYGKIKLLGLTLDNFKLTYNGKISYSVIKQKDFSETKTLESDTENFVNFGLSIKGVVLSILFIELKNGFKVNLRSKGEIAVNLLASEFNGGGHKNASGIRIFDAPLDGYLDRIIKSAENYVSIKGN